MTCISIFDTISSHIQELSLFASALSALIAAIATVAAFKANSQNKKQYNESIQPQLSMSLVEYDSLLYLRVKNTGKLAAKNLEIKVKAVRNNGNPDNACLDNLFKGEFELYPEEIVQGKVAIFGESTMQAVFPQVDISVSYSVDGSKKAVAYDRTVTYLSGYTEKVTVDVNVDQTRIENSLDSIARSSVRTANYLDGSCLAPFDTINKLSDHSLKKDLTYVFGKESQTINTQSQSLNNDKEATTNAHT